MSKIQCFDSSASRDSRVLILGSIPGVASLEANEYYAHPRNAFWIIMGELFGTYPNLPYHERLLKLRKRGIALWDVVHRCVRPGSLDQSIDNNSVTANNFKEFLDTHRSIQTLFFNGARAEILFSRLVLPRLSADLMATPRIRLPSTSPAHAAMSTESKLAAWRVVKRTLEQESPSSEYINSI